MEFDINQEKIQLERNGITKKCDILFTFDSEDTMKTYIGYTDNTTTTDGRKNIYISAFNPLKEKMELENVTDPKELELLEEFLAHLDNDITK